MKMWLGLIAGLFLSFAEAANRLPADFVYLHDVEPSILQDMRYFGDHNFIGRPIRGYHAGVCIMQKRAAQALQRAQQEFLSHGFTLKVYDCYRPQRAVQDFVEWSENDSTLMKAEFYPTLEKDELFPDYIAKYSGHSRGSTIDLTLVKLPAKPNAVYHAGDPLVACTDPVDQRFADNTIDMGTGFDCLSPKANTAHRPLTKTARENRDLLLKTMQKTGFVNHPYEWWHYTLRHERYPHRYFDFLVK